MSFFGTMLLDAYRELNARRMFWITLILSAIAEVPLLLLGLSETNTVKIAWWETPIPLPPSLDLAKLLKLTFVSFGISIWLTWAATILALISTASIFPDFVSSGSIDLLLCRPIGRLRLFLTKYFCALLFVGLQVLAFSLAAFGIIGLRTGHWEPGLFLAVPLVVVFFSYLFCICTLTGVLWRSTVASLLLTLLFWIGLFAANTADGLIVMPRVMNELHVERLEAKLAEARDRPEPDAAAVARLEGQLTEARRSFESWRKWHRPVLWIKTALPKTDETIKLLERSLISTADLPAGEDGDGPQHMPFLTPQMRAAGVRVSDVTQRFEAAYRSRSVAWIVGSSLVFEAVVLALAAAIFARRDF